MKKLRSVFIFLMGCAVFISCSKQVKIENTLTDGEGRWNIDEVESSLKLDTFDVVVTNQDDVGEIIFYPTGSGIWIYYDTTLLVDVARYFEWENSETDLTLDFDDVPAEEPETLFTIVSNSPDSVRLRYERNADSLGLPLNVTTEMLLRKVNELENK